MKKTILFFSMAVAVYGFSSYWMPARIAGIYQGEDYMTVSNIHYNSTVVLVDNPPFTKKGMHELWRDSNKVILDGRNVMQGKYDEIVFLKNRLKRPYNSQELKYWEGDNQFCLMGALNSKCISKDDVFFVIVSNEKKTNREKVKSYNGDEYSIIVVDR